MADKEDLILKCRYYNGEKANTFFQEYMTLCGKRDQAHSLRKPTESIGMTDEEIEEYFIHAVLFDVERCWIEKRLKIFPETVDDDDKVMIGNFISQVGDWNIEGDDTPMSLVAQYYKTCHSPLYKEKVLGRYPSFEDFYRQQILSKQNNTEPKHVVPVAESLSESMIKLGKKGQYELVFPGM